MMGDLALTIKLLGRLLSVRRTYKRKLGDEDAVAAASTPIEKINSPIRLFSCTNDQYSPRHASRGW